MAKTKWTETRELGRIDLGVDAHALSLNVYMFLRLGFFYVT
jgi:hypothetical protein